MTIKLFGAILIIAGCGGLGFSMAAAYRAEERMLRQLTQILQFMQCELRYRLTDLPDLCRMAGDQGRGVLYDIFTRISHELDHCQSPEIRDCIYTSMEQYPLSSAVRSLI